MEAIKLDHVVEAVERWQKLEGLVGSAETEQALADALLKLGPGDDLSEVLSELPRDPTGQNRDDCRAIARSVGLDLPAYQAFIVGMDSALRHLRILPIEEAIDTAAFAGLVVGLMAAQQAEKSSEPGKS